MNASRIAKFAGACALALGCAAVTPGYAQTEGTTPRVETRSDDADYGWIGLFGLAGLLGLLGRKRDTHHYEPPRGATTTR